MNTVKKILVTRNILPSGVKFLQDRGIEVEIYIGDGPIPREILLEKSKNCDGLIAMLSDKIDAEFLELNRHLKIIANYAVGFNNIDLKKAQELGITITNTPDVLTLATAEIAVGLAITVARNFSLAHKSIEENTFKSFDPKGFLGHGLFDKTVGIVGLGRIGLKTAEIFKHGFNANIIYTSQNSTNSIGKKVNNLEELFQCSDIVSVHLPLNDKTANLITKKEFDLMKSNAIFINTARGEIVNQDDLIAALKNKKIFGAGLDVTTPEPLPINHPLKQLSNCYILPHIGSANFETREEMSMMCAQNIWDFIEDKIPRNKIF